jgi:ATP adenylyltransferase
MADKLKTYLEKKMRMSHIYQPVMVRELIKRGGSASVEDIARALLSYDPSQVEYYAIRTKNMVGKVLTDNGVVQPIKEGRTIVGYELAYPVPSETELIEICEAKIDAYLEKRGQRVWDHRRKSNGYIPGTHRYEVLKRARFRCELCGVSAEDKALEVDHILPRNLGGMDDLNNLQALCFSCNAMKRDRDDTDFRDMAEAYRAREDGCLFCHPDRKIIVEDELCYVIEDGFAVTPGHALIIPRRHVADYFGLFQPELNSMNRLLADLKQRLKDEDPTISGFNIGMNAGASAGQTIFHCHTHLIPRRDGDVEDPRGGVRGVIPGKQSY